MKSPFLIIGGGIAGLTTAVALKKKGFEVQVYEKADELREAGAGLGISANAMMAMALLDLEEALLTKGNIVSSIDILSSTGRFLTKASPGKMNTTFSTDSITIHRADLLGSISQALPEGTVHTGKKVIAFQETANGVNVHFADGKQAEGRALIAADGINSAIRKQLMPEVQPRYAGYTAWRGVMDQPPAAFQKDRIAEYWGPEGRVGLVPLYDGRVYWFVCINAKENDPAMKKTSAEELSRKLFAYDGHAAEIIGKTHQKDIVWTDIYDLPTMSHYAKGKVVLIGDAAHATTPNLGQGAGQAMEDAVILAHLLKKEASVNKSFQCFEVARLKRAQQVIRVSHRIGQAAQLSSPFLCGIRNNVMRLLPQSVTEKQFKFLFNVNFEP